jgi:CRISPR-associated endonuclease Csy4
MDFYVDIRVNNIQDMNIKYSKLHKALFDLSADNIGVSFPSMNKNTLGNVMRIHGDKKALSVLKDIFPYYLLCEIEDVSPDAEYCIYRRVKMNMSQSKLRRLLKRGTITTNNTKKYIEKMNKGKLDIPYLEIKSNSTGQIYRRYISCIKCNKNMNGLFDFFGMSETKTVPLW